MAYYRLKELAGEKQGRKAFSTRAAYESYLNGWIVPRWGDLRIDQIKSVAVEEWLDSIKPAKGTRAKIRNHERNLPSRDALRVKETRSSLCAKARNGRAHLTYSN
jgi:hypothetical protein